MYRTTRDLIKGRFPFCEFEPRIVPVERLSRGGNRNCFLNAHQNEDVDILGSGSTKNELISGWVVYPMDVSDKTTEIIQHWWNYDPIAKKFFDTTTFDDSVASLQVEYVYDIDIRNDGMKRFTEIASNVGKDLLYSNSSWHVTEFDKDGADRITKIPDLSIEHILIFR